MILSTRSCTSLIPIKTDSCKDAHRSIHDCHSLYVDSTTFTGTYSAGTRGSWSSPVPDTHRRSGGVNRSERDARCLALWRVHLVAQKHRQKPSIFFSGKHG